jgi:hypothetical protein
VRSDEMAQSTGLRAQGSERRARGRSHTHINDTDSKINTDLKAPLGGFGGEKSEAIRQNLWKNLHNSSHDAEKFTEFKPSTSTCPLPLSF